MWNKGDKVSVLDDDINGVVVAVNGTQITIETEDGFVMNFDEKELVRLNEANNLLDSIRRINVDEIIKEKTVFDFQIQETFHHIEAFDKIRLS